MEVISGGFHAVFPMEDGSRVGEARRHAAQLALDCGLDETEAGRLALVVTELGNNLARHAVRGRLLLSPRPALGEVDVIALDEGPGIANLERSLVDGFSTAGTPGTGLGAVRRLARQFDIHSSVPGGTVVLARVGAGPGPQEGHAICVGAVAIAAPGERVCGDGWAFALQGDVAALLVADGLGHGPDAAEAAAAAIEAFMEDPLASPRVLLAHIHQRLRSTRGAAVMLLQADVASGTVRSAGAGNVMARLVSGTSDRALLSQHGTAGIAVRTPEEQCIAWPEHALLVVSTDGIETRWPPTVLAPLLGRDPTLAAAVLVRDHCRGRDDATVAVLRRKD
ncbi:MAG TPA: SpoIIE family protein phosphatase [Ramlibacter sp.]|uniref:ATP-binding protein n=1 Tax=Ramlibacter sp. TaxID=1917967 RepID=UPI002D7FCB43|nr:SpoIIE family protein phosphatase [Ramlibacter sp.]HET8746053.1 SpoIIE family protein phosphatase [Ramlibacter sp.]